MGVNPGKATNDPNAYFALGFQTAKGSEASTFYFARYGNGTGLEIENEVQREREGGDGQEVGFSYISMVKADGSLAANARAGLIARIFAAGLGDSSVASAAVASLARHTGFPAASLPYVTVDQRWSDEIERAPDCVVTGWTLEGEAGRPWKVSANIISGGTVYQRDVASTLTPAYEGGKPHMFPFGSYTFDGGASYSADVTKIKVELDRNVDDGVQTTGLGRDDVIPLNRDAMVDATIKYTSRAFYQKVKFTGGSVVISDLATGSIDLVQLQQVQVASGVFATGMMRVQLPLIEWTDVKVNKLAPDGESVFLDLVGMTVKGATHSVITTVDVTGVDNTPFA